MSSDRETAKQALRKVFVAGWNDGDYDGGEHDCRMFKPTAQDRWEEFTETPLFKRLMRELTK